MYIEPLSLVKEDECTVLNKVCKITRIEGFRFDCELSDKLRLDMALTVIAVHFYAFFIRML